MTDLDQAALVEMTTEVVAAYVTKNHVRAVELPGLISTVHAALAGMGSTHLWRNRSPPSRSRPSRSGESITDEYLISLEDGQRYKSLKRHLDVSAG